MEVSPPVVILLAASVLSAVGLAGPFAVRRWRARGLQASAEALGGSVQASGLTWSKLVIGEADSRITVDCQFRRRHVSTTLTIATASPMSAFAIEVGAFSSSGSRRGIQLGQVEPFDRLFIVETEDEASLRSRLTPQAQHRLLALARSGIADIRIECTGARLVYERFRQLRPEELRETVSLMRQLAGHSSGLPMAADDGPVRVMP